MSGNFGGSVDSIENNESLLQANTDCSMRSTIIINSLIGDNNNDQNLILNKTKPQNNNSDSDIDINEYSDNDFNID